MELFITAIFFIGISLIATEIFNKVNKAAVAMFMGVTCWLLYIVAGRHFVLTQHLSAFLAAGYQTIATIQEVRTFIAEHVFLSYAMNAAGVVLYLLGTMTIIEVLENNGCFDFIHEALRTRRPKKFLWLISIITFLLSANLDNLTTTCLMLALLHTMVADAELRKRFGSIVVLAANCGGAFTVIGDVTSLSLWGVGLVTPTHYSSMLILPCMAALFTTTYLVHRKLPHSMKLVHTILPYRGDDTVLNRWQRLLMLIIGIGGLWFIPTFHRLTQLPSFVGALCVLGVLWIVDEFCNRSLLTSDKMVSRRRPMALQYQNLQNMLYFIGISLAVGALNETGLLQQVAVWTTTHLHTIYIIGGLAGLLSACFNNMTVMLSDIALFRHVEHLPAFSPNGDFWPLLSYVTALGGSLWLIGSTAGLALWRMEGISFGGYLKHFMPKVLVGGLVGALVFWLTTLL